MKLVSELNLMTMMKTFYWLWGHFLQSTIHIRDRSSAVKRLIYSFASLPADERTQRSMMSVSVCLSVCL